MSDGTTKQLTASVEGLRNLAEWYEAGDLAAIAREWFGTPDELDTEDSVLDALMESPLSVETEVVKSIVFGTGGPHTEIEITLADFGGNDALEDLEVRRGRVVGYWSSNEIERRLTIDEAEAIASLFGLTD